MSTEPTITREQWLARCADRLIEVAKIEKGLALDIANSQLENCNDDLTENPEEAADDEMSYWTED